MTSYQQLPGVTIRRAERRDLSHLARFGAALAAQHGAYDRTRFLTPSDDAFFAVFQEHLSVPDAVLLVAEVEGSPAGYAFIRWEPPSLVDLADAAPWLHDLYLDPVFRGRGIGKALFDAAIDCVAKRGVTKLRLKASPANTSAVRLFHAAGFRTTMLELQLDIPPAGTTLPSDAATTHSAVVLRDERSPSCGSGQ